MNVVLAILVGASALWWLNRQQLQALASLQRGPSYGPGPGSEPIYSAPGVIAPPRLSLPLSTFPPVSPGVGALGDVGAGVAIGGAGVQLAQSGALGAGLAGASAIPIAGAVVAVAAAIVGPLIQAHKARIAGATSENSHDSEMTALFDAAIPQIVSYWNKTHDKAQTLSELNQLQQYMYTTMKGRVGAPGTAWDDAVGVAGKCNKQCTAGCCIYWGDFAGGGAPAYTGINGLIDAVKNGGHRSVTMPKVFPSKYSNFSRALYTVQLN